MKMKDDLVIQDARIFLKILNLEDSEKYRILRNREENRKWFFTDVIISKENQEKWFWQYYAADDEYMFSIYEKASEKYIGAVAIYHIDFQNRKAEIGRIIVDKSIAGGKGYGKEAIQCIVKWGTEQLGISVFYAQIYENNLPSIKTFLGCDFKKREVNNEDKGCQSSQQILVERIVREEKAFKMAGQ